MGIGVALNPIPTVTLMPSEKSWSGYKAILVEEEIPGEVSSTNLIVSNATINPNVNGEYIKENSDLSEYYYKHTEKNLRLYKSGQSWFIEDIDSMVGTYNDGRGENGTEVSDPTLITTWYNAAGGELSDTITIEWKSSEAKTVKYYKFEETLTTDLTYGYGFTPEVDKVYDSEAMIKASLSEKFPILSTPDNLTDYENNEWSVNATNEFASFVAWHVFDGNPDTIWADSGSSYLTWQNKLRQVLVKQLEFIYDGNAHNNYVVTIRLEGSNNGSEWSEIGSATLAYTTDGDYRKATVTFPSNETSYFYHRIYASGQGRNLIGSLIGKRVIE